MTTPPYLIPDPPDRRDLAYLVTFSADPLATEPEVDGPYSEVELEAAVRRARANGLLCMRFDVEGISERGSAMWMPGLKEENE